MTATARIVNTVVYLDHLCTGRLRPKEGAKRLQITDSTNNLHGHLAALAKAAQSFGMNVKKHFTSLLYMIP